MHHLDLIKLCKRAGIHNPLLSHALKDVNSRYTSCPTTGRPRRARQASLLKILETLNDHIQLDLMWINEVFKNLSFIWQTSPPPSLSGCLRNLETSPLTSRQFKNNGSTFMGLLQSSAVTLNSANATKSYHYSTTTTSDSSHTLPTSTKRSERSKENTPFSAKCLSASTKTHSRPKSLLYFPQKFSVAPHIFLILYTRENYSLPSRWFAVTLPLLRDFPLLLSPPIFAMPTYYSRYML